VKKFILGKYHFIVERHENRVLVWVNRIDRLKIDDSEVEELRGLINDIGKWETLVTIVNCLIGDLGFTSDSQEVREYGKDLYNIKVERGEPPYTKEVVVFTFQLSKEELNKREALRAEMLTENEIVNQLKNIQKWRALLKTIEHLSTKA